tara:strand:+ start:380 stop:499 length:120 start_codon:yes stop_codon:yes gene_type:complete
MSSSSNKFKAKIKDLVAQLSKASPSIGEPLKKVVEKVIK